MKRKVVKSSSRRRFVAVDDVPITPIEQRTMAAELSATEERIALATLDSLTAQIAMLDEDGNILAINKAWRVFATNGSQTDRALPGTNYFQHCRTLGAPHFADLAQGAQTVLREQREDFVIEYPCATSGGEKWFHARVTRCEAQGPVRLVIAHEDISDRVELERDIVAVGERAQQRFRQELHDGLSQQLTGLKFKASLLEYHLQSKELAEANDAKALSELLNAATEEAANLARRMRPVEVEARGFMMALRELASIAEHNHEIKCTVTISRPVFIHDNNVATNLYRMAEEAVNSAATHGAATSIQLVLRESAGRVTLEVRDNGKPLTERPDTDLGAHMIRYHARIIGALLEWRSGEKGAALVCCFKKRVAAR